MKDIEKAIPSLELDEDLPLEGKKVKKITTSQSIASRASRRKVVLGTLVFSAFILFYIVFAVIKAPEHLADSTLLGTVAIGVLGLAGTVVIGYIGGQVAQDNNTAKLLAALQARSAISGPRRVSKRSADDNSDSIDSVLEE